MEVPEEMKESLGRALGLPRGIPKRPHYTSDLLIKPNLGSFPVICRLPDFQKVFIDLL